MSIPQETSERFTKCAEAAVDALRHELMIGLGDKRQIIAVFEEVFVYYLRETFKTIAQGEFERLGREHVRGIVLAAFDSFLEKG